MKSKADENLHADAATPFASTSLRVILQSLVGASPCAARATAVLEGAADRYEATRVRVIKIDGWYGPNWLGFAGKILGAVGSGSLTNVAVPPFHPHRVTLEACYAIDPLSRRATPVVEPKLHFEQRSESNTRRYFEHVVCRGTLVAWIGSIPSDASRLSLMIYAIPSQGEVIRWYAEFRETTAGVKSRGVEIATVELDLLAATPPARS